MGNKTPNAPKAFAEMYQNAYYQVLNRRNYLNFIV